jgi:hypothetical protein
VKYAQRVLAWRWRAVVTELNYRLIIRMMDEGGGNNPSRSSAIRYAKTARTCRPDPLERENQSNLKKNALCYHWRFFVNSGAGGHSFSNSQ